MRIPDFKFEISKRWLATSIMFVGLAGSTAFAQPTQDEVFNSIRSHVTDSGSSNAGPIILLVAGGIVLMGVFVYFTRREEKSVAPSSFNHPGKLLKELLREAGLKPADLKHLKMVAEELEEKHQLKLKSPLTLMLCPSVLARAMKRQQQQPKA